jgi:hypothetical protein
MGAGDGTVLGLAKLLDSGPDDERLNIVLLAEGFVDAELPDFEALCDDLVAGLQAEAWFPVLGSAINVFRLNVASNESGADDPATCEDDSEGSGATVATFFDATFCAGATGIRRCLMGDTDLVRDTLDAELPPWDVGSVLVNTNQYGGCASGNVNFTSVDSGWVTVALHELGHAAFGLGDEYSAWAGCSSGETDRDVAPPGEVGLDPNVTTVTNRATLKWRHLISPGVPVPTMLNPDCTECDLRPNVLDDDTKIGLFEGAGYYHCGRFRPAYTCRMRSNPEPYCRVCIEAIAITLAEFGDPTPEIEVEPTFLEFGEVAHGLTMYRSFEVRNRRNGFPGVVDITLSAPTGGFVYAPGTETSFRLTAPVLEAVSSRRVFVAFTAPETGGPEFGGTLEVQTGTPGASPTTTTVTLHALAVPPPPVDSVLVLDRSGSMDEPTGIPGQNKRDHAIQAAHLYVTLLKENDRIGVVRYNQQSDDPDDVLLTMRPAGPVDGGAGRLAALDVVNETTLDPDGSTSIGAGIIRGSAVLDAAVADSRAIVVLTDGRQNTDPDIPDATAVVTPKTPAQRVFAVGLGLNQLEDRLHQIASVTNGVAQITGDLVDDLEFLLQKLYVQILSDVSDEEFVTDPRSVLMPGERRATPVFIGEVDVAADFIVVFRPAPQGVFPKYMHVYLETPDGSLIDPAMGVTSPNVSLHFGEASAFFRAGFPPFPPNPTGHVGRWRVWVENRTGGVVGVATSVAGGGFPLYYSVMCKARSDFRLAGRVLQETHTPGVPMKVELEPTLYGLPIRLDEPVRVQVRRPDGAERSVSMVREDSAYRGLYLDTPLVGPYLFTVSASATSPAGHTVTRFRHMTGLIFVPGSGGQDGGGDGDGPLTDKDCREARRLLKQLAAIIERCCRERPRSRSPEGDDLLGDLVDWVAQITQRLQHRRPL